MEMCAVCLRDIECIENPCKDTSVCAECYYKVFNYPFENLEGRCQLCMQYMADWHIPHSTVISNVSSDTSSLGLSA
jgi:hypothetical protein